MAMEDLSARLEEGWAEPGRAFDDGHRLIGHRVYIAGLGSAIVRGFTKGKFGASAHTVELDVMGGIRRNTVLACVSVARAHTHAELDSQIHPERLQPGEVLDVKEVRRVEGGLVRARVFLRPKGSRKRTRCVWISPIDTEGTVCFIDRAKKQLASLPAAPGASDAVPEPEPQVQPDPQLNATPEPEPQPEMEEPQLSGHGPKQPEPEPETPPAWAHEAGPTKQVKLRRKGNGETPWLIWPRGKLPDDDAPVPICLQRTVTVPWEEQVELLQNQGWRLPTRKESLMDSELVNYNIYVSGYGPGRVLKFIQSSFGPSEHQVLFDDERFKKVRVKLRRKGNQETPWMVMPGLLHRRPGMGSGSWVDDDDEEEEDWEYEEEQGLEERSAQMVSVAREQQLVPVEEGPETPPNGPEMTPSSPVTPLPKLNEKEETLLVRAQSLVRGKVVRKMLTKSQQKRRHIAQELLMTEDTYVKGLRGLVTAYVRPLQELVGTEREVLTMSQIRTIFSEIEAILLMHDTQLLPQLKQKVNPDNWTQQQTIGDLFGKTFASLLKMYTFYANNYMQALTLYGELSRECEPFIKFAQEVQAEGAVTGSVEGYLITPIQRIPRYVMLLHELKKATLPAHPDTPLLSLAVQSIEEVANHVNEQKRDAENRAQVAVISRRLISSTMVRKALQLPADFELVQPDRQLIKNGNLDDVRGTWLSSGNGELKKRTFFLFNDLFIKGQLADSADAPCAYRGMIKIDHTSIICRGRARMNQKWHPAFSLRGRGEGDGNEWVMLADSNADREEWVAALNRCRNWKHSFAVDYAKKLVLEQAAKDREETERAKTTKRAARRASLEPSLNPYSLDRFDQFLAAQASTTLAIPEQPEQPDRARGRLRQSTDAALADIDQALATMVGSHVVAQTELKEDEDEQVELDDEEEEEEEDEMPSPAVVRSGEAGVAVHFAPGLAPSVGTHTPVHMAATKQSRSATLGRRSSLPDINSSGLRTQPSMVSIAALPQTSSPAIGSPQSFTSGTDSVNISMTASDLESTVATAGEEVDYRRVLGEDSVIEVELIRVDPDDLEGPLGVEARSGVSGGSTPVSSGWSTPQSARSSFARASIATVSSRGRRGPIGRYRVLHQCKYRADVSIESEELGYLTEGWVIKVWEKQMTEEGQTRMRFTRSKEGVKARGWVSLKAKNGKRLLMAENSS